MSGIAVYMEARDGHVKASALEALSEARRLKSSLGGEVIACVVGHDVAALIDQVKDRGPDKVIAVEGPILAQYSTEGYALSLAQIIRSTGSETVLLGATVQGRDLGPAIAAVLDGAYAAECLSTDVVDGKLRVVRPVYAGKAWATVSANVTPFVASLRPNVFEIDASQGTGAASVETVAPEFGDDKIRARVTGSAAPSKGKKDVAEADVVVAGGRGLGSPEGFKPLEELAEVLGAAVGASRAVVDMGWRPHSEQVGQTGKVVSPKLYIAVGISGAIQHLAGMRTSKVIVAINKDPEAPIFKVADYGIVGDLVEVLPALTAALRG